MKEKLFRISTLFLYAVGLFLTQPALGEGGEKTLLYESDKTITGLLEAHFERADEASDTKSDNATISIVGQYARPGWKLFFEGNEIPVSDSGGFAGEFTVPKTAKVFKLKALGPDGEEELQTCKLVNPQWADVYVSVDKPEARKPAEEEKPKEAAAEPPKEASTFTFPNEGPFIKRFNLGYSFASYSQTGLSDLNEQLLYIDGSAFYKIPQLPPYFAFATFYFTPFSISKNDPDNKALFLNFEVGAGRVINVGDPKGELSVRLGLEYETMVTSGVSFGYRNATGPQVSAKYRRFFSQADSLSAILRYSVPGTDFSMFSFSNRRFMAGLHWEHSYKIGNLIAGLDFMTSKYQFSNGDARTSIFTLVGGYTF